MKAQERARSVRNRFMVGVTTVALLTLGATAAPAQAAPVLLENQPDGGVMCLFDTAGEVGQSFTAPVDGDLNSVGFYVDAAQESTATLRVYVHEGSDSFPLVEQDITIPATGPDGLVLTTLDFPMQVTANATYSFGVEMSTGCPFRFSTGAGYDGGTLLIDRQPQPDEADLAFLLGFDDESEPQTAPGLSGTPTNGQVGAAYSFQYTVTGVPAPTLSVGGDLPPGLTLSQDGLLSGTPTQAGTFSFRLSASNPSGFVAIATSVTITEATKPKADLKLSLTAPATVQRSGTFNYSVTVTNDGPSTASNVQTTVALPPGVRFVSASPSVKMVGSVAWWSVPELAKGQSATLTIKVKAVDKGKQIAAGLTWSSIRDDRPLNNVASAVTQVK